MKLASSESFETDRQVSVTTRRSFSFITLPGYLVNRMTMLAILLITIPVMAQPIEIKDLKRTGKVDFAKEILPILRRNCLACHNDTEKDGGLVLESPNLMRKGGSSGEAIVPGNPEESLLLELASHRDEPKMPPPKNKVNAQPLSSTELGLIKLWIKQGATGTSGIKSLSPKRWNTLKNTTAPVYSVALSVDGQHVAVSRSNQLFIYHTNTGRLISRLSDPELGTDSTSPPIAHRDVIESLAMSVEGDLLASGSFREIKLWRRPRDVQLSSFTTGVPVSALAVHPSSGILATPGPEHAIQLWDSQKGSVIKLLKGHRDTVTSLTISPDGSLLASASLDQTIRVWDLKTGASRGMIESPKAVNAVEFVPVAAPSDKTPTPENILVSGGDENMVRSWIVPRSAPKQLAPPIQNAERTCFSADRRHIATADKLGNIRVFIHRDGQDLSQQSERTVVEWRLPGKKEPSALAFLSPDGKDDARGLQLITANPEGELTVWQVSDQSVVDQWLSVSQGINSLATSPSGQQLATGFENGTVAIWNGIGQNRVTKDLKAIAQSSIHLTVVSPSRKLVAMAGVSQGKPVVLIRNLDNGKLETLLGHTSQITALAFSRDNNRIATGSRDKSVRIWTVTNPTDPMILEHPDIVTCVAFNRDGTQLLTGGDMNKARFWNTKEGSQIHELGGHTDALIAVGFDSANKPITLSRDKSVRFWNPGDGKQTRTFSIPAAPVAAALRDDGQVLAVAGNDQIIRLVQVSNGKVLQSLTGHQFNATTLSFSIDGKRLASSAQVDDSQLESRIWNLESPTTHLIEGFRQPSVVAVLMGEHNNNTLSVQRDSRTSLETIRLARQLAGNTKSVSDVIYNADGRTLFTASSDGSLRGFSTSDGKQTFATNHGAGVLDLALSSNQQMLATAGVNKTVRLWQINGRANNPSQLTGFPDQVTSVSFSADSTRVIAASGTDKPVASVFDTKTGSLLEQFTLHTKPVLGMTWIPGANSRVLSLSSDSAWEWSLHAARIITGHSRAITSLVRHPTTPLQFFSGSIDATIRHWNASSGQQYRQYSHGGPVLGIAVRPDGQRLASVSDNKRAKLWNINGRQIAEMRGDVRLLNSVARLTQEQNAANQRVNLAKQQLASAEKDKPLKVAAQKKVKEALDKATKDANDKKTTVTKTLNEKTVVEKFAIETSAQASDSTQAQISAETAAREAASAITILQQRASRISNASNAQPDNEALKTASKEAQDQLTAARSKSAELQKAIDAPRKTAQADSKKANDAAQKVSQVQKPYTDALAALRTAESAVNLASQQHVIAVRELKESEAQIPVAKQRLTQLEKEFEMIKASLEKVKKESAEAELPFRSIDFSPDGQIIATASDYTSVHTWDSETGTALDSFVGHKASPTCVKFLSDNKLVSGSGDQSARVWDLNPSWHLEQRIGAVDQPELISHRVMALDISKDGKLLLAGGGIPSRHGELHIFQIIDGKRTLFIPKAHDDVVHAAEFSPDEKRIASGGADKYARTFDIASAEQLHRFEGHTNYVLGVSWKGNGQSLVTASADQLIKVWNSETGDQTRTIRNFSKHLTSVRYVGESDNIVSSSGDRMARLHSAANGRTIRNFGGSDSWIHCIDVTPDNNVIAAGTATGKLLLWNGNNGRMIQTIEPLTVTND